MTEIIRTFTDDVYEDRRARLQKAIRKARLAGALVLGRANRVYLTGFGPEGGSLLRFVALCLPAEGEPVYIISDIDKDRATGLTIPVRPVAYGEGVGVAAKVLESWSEGMVGIEAGVCSLLVADGLREATGRTLVAADALMSSLRAVKTPAEIEVLRQASVHTDVVVEYARSLAKEGVSERELAGAMVHEAMKRGCEMPEIPFVLTGERAMMPHLRPSDRRFQQGELVVIDFGVGFSGYETDICRTFAVGEPGQFALEVHVVVLAAFNAAVATAQPGRRAEEVHLAAYDVIASAGFGDFFIHGVGHGVGVQSHEPPLLAFGSDTVLEEGMVLAIEPGIYTRGVGLRLEDDVVVRTGGGERLNRASMAL